MYLLQGGYGDSREKEACKKEKTEKPVNLQVTLYTCLLHVQQVSIFKFSTAFKFQENL